MSRPVEIQSTFGMRLPRIPGKRVRFLNDLKYEAEVFAEGSDVPEWSAQGASLTEVARKVCKEYDIPVSSLQIPRSDDEEL